MGWPFLVTLSVAKGLSPCASRCFAALSMTVPPCHPERSEGPVSMRLEMLRCPQHDSAVLLPPAPRCPALPNPNHIASLKQVRCYRNRDDEVSHHNQAW